MNKIREILEDIEFILVHWDCEDIRKKYDGEIDKVLDEAENAICNFRLNELLTKDDLIEIIENHLKANVHDCLSGILADEILEKRKKRN